MSRLRSAALTVVMLVVGALLFAGRLAPDSLAQTPPDRSEVVLVLDFSASILEDVANRDRFAAALDRIADRVDATSSDLVAGDATVTIVQFATSAADYPGCVDLKLLDSPRDRRALRRLPQERRQGVPKGPGSRSHPEDRRRHELRRRHGAGGPAPCRGRRPAGADPVHRRQARRPGGARQPGAAGARQALREPVAVRAAAGRHGPRPDGARCARTRSRQPADHPRDARLRQRGAVRLAAGRVRVTR